MTIEPPAPAEGPKAMSRFERFLTVWVALCIVVGVVLGHFLPTTFEAIGSAEIAKVNLPVAVLIWLMIVPMLLKIDLGALGSVRQHWKGVGVALFITGGVFHQVELFGSPNNLVPSPGELGFLPALEFAGLVSCAIYYEHHGTPQEISHKVTIWDKAEADVREVVRPCPYSHHYMRQ